MNHAKQTSVKWRQPRYLRAGVRDNSMGLAMLGIVSCSSLPTNLAVDGSIRVERHDSRYTHFAHTFGVRPDAVRTVAVVHHGQGERHG